jgi:hypothetical protein
MLMVLRKPAVVLGFMWFCCLVVILATESAGSGSLSGAALPESKIAMQKATNTVE